MLNRYCQLSDKTRNLLILSSFIPEQQSCDTAVLCVQQSDPITGKGNARDEFPSVFVEMISELRPHARTRHAYLMESSIMSDRTVRNPIIPRCCLCCSRSDRSLRQLQARQLSAKYRRTSQSNGMCPSFGHESRPRCADVSVTRRPKQSGFITFLLLTFRRISTGFQPGHRRRHCVL